MEFFFKSLVANVKIIKKYESENIFQSEMQLRTKRKKVLHYVSL